MSCEIKVRQCERCELTEGTVLCQECTGKEESDPVCYCATCSELVHKGRIAKHRLTLLEPGVGQIQVTKDEADSLIAKYKREVACLSKKIDEVEKAKDNITELMQKHDKAIRQTITVVVRQLQERGKYFIQQVAARSSEKKEQLTAIQAQLQDTQKDISQQIGSLEEILKKSDTKDKVEMAGVEAVMKDTEAAVQGKIEDTFKSVKLPELDTDFDIDTSCVAEAVQALQINIHPEPSDEVIAERNDIEVPDLKISPDAEIAAMEAFVSGPLTRNGLFWAVPRFSKEMEAKLLRLSMLIRKTYIENATWKSFGDAGIQPTIGGDVYALYDADHKWYRGRVEDIKSSRRGSTVRFTDYGNTQNVSHANMLPACDSLAPRCAQQGRIELAGEPHETLPINGISNANVTLICTGEKTRSDDTAVKRA